MPTFVRFGVLLLAATTLVGGLAALAHCCLGYDFGPRACAELINAQQRGEKLDVQNRAVLVRNERLRVAALDVIARRRTLAQGAEDFRGIHEETWRDINAL